MPSPPLVFLGDTHGYADDFKKQKEIISEIMPEFVLSEQLENISLESKKDYLKFFKKKKISNMTAFEEAEKLAKFCYQNKMKLVGIDLKNFGFDKKLQIKIIKQEKPSKKEESQIKKLLSKREKRHIILIKRYLKQTKKPLLVIVGSWHLQDDSELMKTFKNCRIIFPSDRKGNILIEPSGNGEVFYREKIKCLKS